MRLLIMTLLSVLLMTIGCKTLTPSVTPSASSDDSSGLPLTEAEWRKAHVDGVQYGLHVNLTENKETFEGQSEIDFQFKGQADRPLRLDFFEGETENMTLNGQPIPATAKKRFWIEIPAQLIKNGANTFKTDYVANYSHQGQGLHKFTDPETQEIFLYSQFEAFDAHRFMPCFDQPDLKATLELSVNAPAKWEVVSTSRESAAVKKGDRKIWTFPISPKISTYLFSLHAGPYRVWKDQFQNIPLRLFARPSQAKYVHVAEWFKLTKQGLKFYNEYFSFPYPFKKYDQLVVPEFNAGAMENVAAVTFTESYLQRSAPTREMRSYLANTLLHEMAHMWFGDIVTMKWWNDLWLNESFASYMAQLSSSEATEFKEMPLTAFSFGKARAYWADESITTHPIEAKVDDVRVAQANFDGISYGKGAAVLQQLRAYVTPESFRKGLSKYIHDHAYQNATLKDFIAALQSFTSRDLTLFADRWLLQTGVDRVAAHWNCEGERLKTIMLTTTPSAGAKFRPQTVQVGLLYEKKGSKPEVIRADIDEPQETLTGDWPCPSFVYPNYGDDGYMTISLDLTSQGYAQKHLSEISDPLLRAMLWHDFWFMVRHGDMPLDEYVKLMETQFPREQNIYILRRLVAFVANGNDRETILQYWPLSADAKARLADFVAKMEANFLERFKKSKAGSDDQKFWFDSYIGLARTPEALKQLADWYENPNAAPGFKVDIDRQWDLVRQLMRYRFKNAPKFLAEMKKKDRTDRGVREAMAIEAIQPDLNVKKTWYAQVKTTQPKLTFAQTRVVLHNLFPYEQTSLAQRFEKEYYEYLKDNGNSENMLFVNSFAAGANPLDCDANQSNRMREFLESDAKVSPMVTKTLKISLDEDERCQRIRAMSRL